MIKIYRFFLSLLYKKPKNKLLWNNKDFESGKRWAKTQPHPLDSKKTLWDYVKREDSLNTINELNKFIK
jgi:hypothetical protein